MTDGSGNQPCKDCMTVTTGEGRRIQMFIGEQYGYTLCATCYRRRRVIEYEKTGVLSGSLWLDLTLAYRDQWDNPTLPFLVSMEKIKDAAACFGRDIWFDGGLQQFFKDSKYSTFSMEDDTGFKLLMMASAGIALFTFRSPCGHSVTLITDESSDTAVMGVHGIDATEDLALRLIDRGTKLYLGGMRPKLDREVGFGF